MIFPGFELIVAHLLGDYVFQNDFLATGKHARAVAGTRDEEERRRRGKYITLTCLLHALLYTLAFVLITWNAYPPLFYLSILVPHFLIDRMDVAPKVMDLIGQKGFREHLAPWSTIIHDNTLHLLCVFLSVRLLL